MVAVKESRHFDVKGFEKRSRQIDFMHTGLATSKGAKRKSVSAALIFLLPKSTEIKARSGQDGPGLATSIGGLLILFHCVCCCFLLKG